MLAEDHAETIKFLSDGPVVVHLGKVSSVPSALPRCFDTLLTGAMTCFFEARSSLREVVFLGHEQNVKVIRVEEVVSFLPSPVPGEDSSGDFRCH